jgi:aminomuconate-semialdehyde dehydrogenase
VGIVLPFLGSPPCYSGATSMASPLCSALWNCNTFGKAHEYLENTKSSPLTLENYISNIFVPASSGYYINSFNPKTGEVFSQIPLSTPKDIDAAVLSAEFAFKKWSKTTRAERSKYLQTIATLIQENRELFAVWESIDQGKTVERARVEVDRAVSNFS